MQTFSARFALTRSRFARGVVALSLCAAFGAAAAPPKQGNAAGELIVVCSPGSPGSTDEARPTLDAFAAAASAKSGVALTAVYDPSDSGGAARLASAGIGIVTLPFFLEHERDLGLHARLDVVRKGRPDIEPWVLVAQKARVANGASLAGFTIASNAAFAPAFVRGAVHELGALPANVELKQVTAVLSWLRRAADGEPVAVLLDGQDAAAVASLPFASKLEVVAHSPAMPAAVVVTTKHVTEQAWPQIAAGLVALASEPTAAAVLDGLQIARFTPVDDAALSAARDAYAKGSR